MKEEVKEKILSIIRKEPRLKYKLEAWKNRMHPNWNILDVWQCIYDHAEGKSNTIVDIVNKLTILPKVYGRANAAYGRDRTTNGMDIVIDDGGNMKLLGYDATPTTPPQKGVKGHENTNIYRKSDDQVKKSYENMEELFYNIGARIRKKYPNASNETITNILTAIKKHSEVTKKGMTLIMSRLERGVYKLTSDYKIVPVKKTDESVVKGRTIVITESMVEELRKEEEMTEYKFYSNIKRFIHDLLVDPANAKPSDILVSHKLDRKRLLYHLLKGEIVKKSEKICDTDEDGNPKTATMKVRYSVPKKNFDKKLKRLFIKSFEENVPTNDVVNEDGEAGMMGGTTSAMSSGQYEAPLFSVQRRKFNEDTTLNSIGDYQYDVPFVGDEETLERGTGVGGSTSINHIDEYLDKNMTQVKKSIENAKDNYGDTWADKPYGEDKREVVHNEWMIHFADMQELGGIAKNGFKEGNRYKDAAQQVTYQRPKYEGGTFNYAYLASDVLEAFNASTDVELNDLRSSFMYYLSQERQDGFVMFKGNGYRFFHSGDAENQVVFNNIVPDTKVLILPLYNSYCVMSSIAPNFKDSNSKQLNKTEGGRVIRNRKDNPKNMLDNILFHSRDIEKVIQWVMTNYEQYHNKFKY